ncbi:MAG: hypothetical protein LBQ65_03230 [Tannerellaceae bacterium]|jgi:hypothetical protein|nr:hypothetical protein [Tannerellaceae bacterium]
MKTMHVKRHLWLIGLLLIGHNLAGWAEDLDSSKKKEINQSFAVGASDQLNVDNRYGSITVTHWTKNEVAIQVIIVSKAGNDSRAQEGLERVQIELNKSGNTVYAITSIKNSAGWSNGNNSLTIDYYISMPSKLAASIAQKYGNINLPEKNEGKCSIEVAYGNIHAGSFTEPLRIDGKYSNIHLGDVKELSMDVRYCGNTVMGNAENVRIDSKYSNLRLRNVDKLNLENSYGNVQIERAKVIAAEIKYSEAKVKNLTETLDLSSLSYSTLSVAELDAGFKRVQAEAHYGTLNLSISPQAAFRVSAEAIKYGKIEIKGLKITESNVENKVNHFYQINGGVNSQIRFEGNNYSNLKINAL